MSAFTELVEEMHRRSMAAQDAQYRIVMRADMFYFMRCHVINSRFKDSLMWLRREVRLKVRITGFARVPKPVYHGAAEK